MNIKYNKFNDKIIHIDNDENVYILKHDPHEDNSSFSLYRYSLSINNFKVLVDLNNLKNKILLKKTNEIFAIYIEDFLKVIIYQKNKNENITIENVTMDSFVIDEDDFRNFAITHENNVYFWLK